MQIAQLVEQLPDSCAQVGDYFNIYLKLCGCSVGVLLSL